MVWKAIWYFYLVFRVQNIETAQEILRKQELESREIAQENSHSTRRTSFEERNIQKYVSTAENE